MELLAQFSGLISTLIFLVLGGAVLRAIVRLYTVVDPSEAHIVVFMGKGRKVYTPHVEEDGKTHPTAYFFIPILMQRRILPLANVKLEIPKFELRDLEVAPFLCEAVCWFRIKNPALAVEKLDIKEGEEGFENSVRETLEEQIRGIARASAMKQEVLDIMRDRKKFGEGVETEANAALDEWGLQIVQLEIVDFSDKEGSHIIGDYENMRESEIEAISRQKVAGQNRDAEIAEALAKKESGVKQAESEMEIEKARVEKKKQVSISVQDADRDISERMEEANRQKVEAQRTLEVGQANVRKEATITIAEGEAEATFNKGKADADIVQAKGTAEAEVIKQKGLSEATAKDKMAEALKKFTEAGITLEQIRALVDIQKSKFENLGAALKEANVNLVSGGDGGKIFGFDLNAETGAGLAQALKAFEAVAGEGIGKTIKKVIGKGKA